MTDDHDLLFLYVVEIAEQEFLILKQEQSLNVDYQDFPTMLSQLFEHCLSSARDERLKFRAVLDLTKQPEALFSVIEVGSFKDLPHLYLKMRSSSDEQLKKHLSSNLAVARQENDRLRDNQMNLTESLQLREADVERVCHILTLAS